MNVSPHRAAADAEAFFRRALTEAEGQPCRVTSDKAGCYPPALAAVLPAVEHATGKLVQQRIERDHQHLKGRLRPMRCFKTRPAAQVVCAGHAFVRNLGAVFYDPEAAADPGAAPLAMRAWDELTDALLGVGGGCAQSRGCRWPSPTGGRPASASDPPLPPSHDSTLMKPCPAS